MFVIKTCLILVVLAIVLQDCGNDTPAEYRRLFKLPVEQQFTEFRKYPLEEQIDIYVEAMRGVEPPATQFAGFLASNGKSVIPLLLKRLREEKRDRVRYYYVRVFDEVHSNYCSLKGHHEVIESLRQVISEMKDTTYKELCELSLKTILEQPGAGSPC